jgi:hypothetical protein
VNTPGWTGSALAAETMLQSSGFADMVAKVKPAVSSRRRKDRKPSPLRSFAADAHGCIMVRNRPPKTMRGLFLMQRIMKRDAEGHQDQYG